MTENRLRAPEAIQTGGFQGGTFVQAERAPEDGRLAQLAQSLGNFSGSLDRAMVTRETNRIEGLRRDAESEAAQIQAQFQGYTADQIGEALESEPLAQRFRDNPYILPALQVHRGRVAADELTTRMLESGVNPSDAEAVNQYLRENTPQSDDAFFSRGLNEQLERRRAQWTQAQITQALQDAEGQRLEMGQREFDTVYEDTGDWGAALEALAGVEGVSPAERTDIQMASATRLANEGRVEELNALLDAARGDAPALSRDTRLAQQVGTLQNRARVRQEDARRDAGREILTDLRNEVYSGFFPTEAALERDPRYAQLTSGQQAQARDHIFRFNREQAAEAEREASRVDREREREAQDEAVMAVDDMLAQGMTLEQIEASEAYSQLGDREAVVRRRIRAANASGSSASARARVREWEAQAEQAQAESDAAAIVAGDEPLWEDVEKSNADLEASHTITSRSRREAAVRTLREAALGRDPWNLPPEAGGAYAQYARTLRRAGLEDPQLNQLMDRASGLLTTESVALPGSTEDAERVFRIYRQFDGAMRSEFVDDARTRAVMENVDGYLTRNPEASFGDALQSAVAQHELAANMEVSYDRDFTRYEGRISYRIEDPESGREVNVARLDRWRTASRQRRDDPSAPVRQFVQDRFLAYRAAGIRADDAAAMASQDIGSEWTVVNGSPVQLPPRREGGRETGPAQWARAVSLFLEAEAYEGGIEDPSDITITHLDRGIYAVRRPDGGIRVVPAQLLMAEAGDWLDYETPRVLQEAAREAGALPTNQ